MPRPMDQRVGVGPAPVLRQREVVGRLEAVDEVIPLAPHMRGTVPACLKDIVQLREPAQS